MPKFYCEYCDIYLTHSSPAGRKQHTSGKKHIGAKVEYYQNLIRQGNFQPPVFAGIQIPVPVAPPIPGMAMAHTRPMMRPPMPGPYMQPPRSMPIPMGANYAPPLGMHMAGMPIGAGGNMNRPGPYYRPPPPPGNAYSS